MGAPSLGPREGGFPEPGSPDLGLGPLPVACSRCSWVCVRACAMVGLSRPSVVDSRCAWVCVRAGRWLALHNLQWRVVGALCPRVCVRAGRWLALHGLR